MESELTEIQWEQAWKLPVFSVCRVRQKQNKYPILFLTQGVSDIYPELMDLRCRTTEIAMSFAQSEDILVRDEAHPYGGSFHFMMSKVYYSNTLNCVNNFTSCSREPISNLYMVTLLGGGLGASWPLTSSGVVGVVLVFQSMEYQV